MIKDRRWDTWIGISNLLDLIWQPEHHFSQQLGVGLKHISSMALEAGTTELVQINRSDTKSVCSIQKCFYYAIPSHIAEGRKGSCLEERRLCEGGGVGLSSQALLHPAGSSRTPGGT